MFILNSIAPIFLLIALGKVLRKTDFLPEAFFKGINRFVFWFALPAMLVGSISAAKLELGTIYRIIGLFGLGTLGALGIAWGISRMLKLPSPSTGSFIQGSFRGNGAFVGLPVIIYTLSDLDPHIESLGTVVLAPVVVTFNILSVIVLLHYSKDKHSTGESVATVIQQLFKNPLLMACIAGLALNLMGIGLPLFLNRSLDALGKSALPLVLMSIGAGLTFEPIKGAASPSLIASLVKVVIAPGLGFLLAGLFGLSLTERMIAIFYLACPAAGMSYVMADVMGNDATLASRIIALSTLLSGITIPIIIAIGL